MTYYLGIDLGTTFTSAGVFRDGWVATASLSNHEPSTKSVVFVKEDGTILSGEAAERRGLIEPERVGREFKRRLGDPQPLFLGGSPYSAEQLTSRLLKYVLDRVDKAEGRGPAGVAISHPANWGPYKIDLLRQAVQMAGLPDSTVFLAEPEAAAIFYAEDSRLETGQIVAVYDLGGGTFDAAILRKTDDGFEFLGKPVGIERLGGIDFDAAVFAHVSRELGDQIAQLDPNDQPSLMAVARLRGDCTLAREALSDDNEVLIPVVLPGSTTEVRLTRNEFEAMIRPGLAETVSALQRALASADVSASDLHTVLLVGGCSRTPLVSQMISAKLGCPVALCPDLLHSVAMGGAHAAARADTSRQPVASPTPTAQPIVVAPIVLPKAAPPQSALDNPSLPVPPERLLPPERLVPPEVIAPLIPSAPAAPAHAATAMPSQATQHQTPLTQAPPATDGSTQAVANQSAPNQLAPNQSAPKQVVPNQSAPPLAAGSGPPPIDLSETVSNSSKRGALLVGLSLATLLTVGAAAYAITRGDDRSETLTAAEGASDSGISQELEVYGTSTVPEPDAPTDKNVVTATIDKGSMVAINEAAPTIGTNDEASTLSPPEIAAQVQLDSPVEAFVDLNPTTNIQFYDFATFTSAVTDGDPLETWLSLVPDTWLETITTIPTDFADLGVNANQPIIGVNWAAADRYCSYALKRMPSEIEWELVAVEGGIEFASNQNWVSESDEYGSLPPGATVVRGSSGPEDASVYHRTISPSGDGIANAGVRCAADAVNEVARPSGELLYSRIFGGEDEPRDWPDLHDPTNKNIVFGYHSPDVFHIELAEPALVAVSSGELHTGDTEVSMNVELRKPKEGSGGFRYGLLTRASSSGALTFMVHPQADYAGQLELLWCATVSSRALVPSGEIYGIEWGYEVGCDLEGSVVVESFRNDISVRFEGGTAEFFVDGTMVGSMNNDLPRDGEFGVVSETFEGDPLTHIHFDNLVVKTS